jgi:hypothetical protein
MTSSAILVPLAAPVIKVATVPVPSLLVFAVAMLTDETRGVTAKAGAVAIYCSYRNVCHKNMRAAAFAPAAKSLICDVWIVTGSAPATP